jgi:methylthioribose-1-phosphate isomerase
MQRLSNASVFMEGTTKMSDLRPIRWAESGDAVEILDQTLLPEAEVILRLESAEAVADAIRTMQVRGAPAIGILGAMGFAVDAAKHTKLPASDFRMRLSEARELLASARPTGANLRWALDRLYRLANSLGETVDNGVIACKLWGEATAILDEDRAMCRAIGEHGLRLLGEGPVRVLTHCNAGALATGGIGTATAPLYVAHEAGRDVTVFASETRPLLQGSRLTAWELARAGIDVTLVIDSAAALVLRDGAVDAVIVGADRIAANGDVANKVGTYSLSVLARQHGIPFYVAAPSSTVDLATATGADIPIEVRDADEVRLGFGKRTAPHGVPVRVPAFDVTPAAHIAAIITESGVHRPPFGPSLAGA